MPNKVLRRGGLWLLRHPEFRENFCLCHSGTTDSGLKQQKCASSWFWMLEVWDQGVSSVDFSWEFLSLACRWCSSPTDSHGFSSMSIRAPNGSSNNGVSTSTNSSGILHPGNTLLRTTSYLHAPPCPMQLLFFNWNNQKQRFHI